MLVGEIGIDRHTFFYELRWWEVKAIIRGYNNRYRNLWSSTRWHAYQVMTAQVGSKEMSKASINSPKDLLPLPWEKEPTEPISKADRDELLAEMDAINAQLAAQNKE